MYFRKSTILYLIEVMGMVCTLHLVSAAPGHNNAGGKGANIGAVHVGPTKCTLHRIEPLMIEETDEDVEQASTVCVMDPQYEGGIKGISYEVDASSFPRGYLDDVEFSETELTISATAVSKAKGKHGGGLISALPGADIKKEKKALNSVEKAKGNLRGNNTPLFDRRRLAQSMGNSTLIVLFAVPPDAINDARTSVQLANDIFGINTTEAADTINVRTQMSRCSRGQLEYLPACGTPDQACAGEEKIVNGVLEVPIDQNVTDVKSGTVVNWVKAEAQVILNGTGIDIFSFNQIMVVIPTEASWGGAAAWAYLPGQLSAFRDTYSYRMGVQMHEFGHNLGFGHSGFDGKSYKDHSCMMGSPSYGDDGPEICWNGAKGWQSGWYASDSISVEPSANAVSVDLIGVADWADEVYTPNVHRVVVEIQDASEIDSFYLGFNRAKGPNQGVTFAQDEVTVTMARFKKTSWHQAGLGAPNATANVFPIFRKSNYNGGEKDLVVKVCEMVAGVEGQSPDVAKILIYTDDGAGWNNGQMCPDEVGCIADSQCDDGNWCTVNTCDTTTNTCNPPEDISATQCPTCGELTYCNPDGSCDAVCDDGKTCSADSCVDGQCQNDSISGCSVPGALLEKWNSIDGSKVTDLLESVQYNYKQPDQITVITDKLKAEPSRGSNFGDRLTTYIVPNITGTYNFYVASDDYSELWLSTDENPSNINKIAHVNGYTGDEVWDKFSSQKSQGISLVGGKAYYMKVLHKEGGGGDNLSIGWESADASLSLTVINGSYFFMEPPVGGTYAPTSHPTQQPTQSPSKSPSVSPSTQPTMSPTLNPTTTPTRSPSKSPSVSPTFNPTKGPTSAPTTSPSVSPSSSPTSPTQSPSYSPSRTTLHDVGQNPPTSIPLELCEGDCDSDSDCAEGLLCFERSGTGEVPGCAGTGTSGWDYCAKRESVNHLWSSPGPEINRGLCIGDCDEDSDCAGDLQCFQRGGYTPVPGCVGEGNSSKDYCAVRETANTLFLKGDNGSPAINFPLGECDGDCDNDAECAGDLICFQRSGTTSVPGCLGEGSPGKDYCVQPPSSAPTLSPTP